LPMVPAAPSDVDAAPTVVAAQETSAAAAPAPASPPAPEAAPVAPRAQVVVQPAAGQVPSDSVRPESVSPPVVGAASAQLAQAGRGGQPKGKATKGVGEDTGAAVTRTAAPWPNNGESSAPAKPGSAAGTKIKAVDPPRPVASDKAISAKSAGMQKKSTRRGIRLKVDDGQGPDFE
jgi:hypothetical protein